MMEFVVLNFRTLAELVLNAAALRLKIDSGSDDTGSVRSPILPIEYVLIRLKIREGTLDKNIV